MLRLLTRVKWLCRDPGDTQTLIWQWWVNGVLGAHGCSSLIRTLGYRFAGLDVDLRCQFKPGVIVRSRKLSIGSGSTVNYRCVFDNRAGVRIGRRVGVSVGVSFITSGHDMSDSRARAGLGRLAPIVVGDGAWIGANATILGGVSIGPGAVVGAGALVTRDCDANALYIGIPARKVRDL